MSKAVSTNYKTIKDFNPDTDCPRRAAGEACSYCYVEAHRNAGDLFSKTIVLRSSYDGEVLRLKADTINKLNSIGGIRMFGSTDYRRSTEKLVRAFLDDCRAVRLHVKAITKNQHFVHDWHHHKALKLINVSIDSLHGKEGLCGSPVSMKQAQRMKATYNKVRIRTVAVCKEDVEVYGKDPTIDVITLYHGTDKRFYNFSTEERKAYAERFPNKICCEFGHCLGCNSKCGMGLG